MRKRKATFKVGDRVELPDMKGIKFAGQPAIQDPRNVGQTGKIIAIIDVGGVPCPRIRLDGGSRRIVHGYECWWKPLAKRRRAARPAEPGKPEGRAT